MKVLQCDICGGKLTMDATGQFAICESCGMTHSKDRLNQKVQEIIGTVKIDGPVEVKVINNEDNIDNLIEMGIMDIDKGEISGSISEHTHQNAIYNIHIIVEGNKFKKILDIRPTSKIALLGMMVADFENCNLYYKKLISITDGISAEEKEFLSKTNNLAIFMAAYICVGDIGRCKYILENYTCKLQGVYINKRFTDMQHEYSLLWYAALLKKYDIVKLLLEYDADVTFKHRYRYNSITLLEYGCYANDYELCKVLLNAKPNLHNNTIALNISLEHSDISLIELLLKFGVDISGNSENIYEDTYGDYKFKHPLCIATKKVENPAILKLLLEYGGNPNFEIIYNNKKHLRLIDLTNDSNKIAILKQFGGRKKGILGGLF